MIKTFHFIEFQVKLSYTFRGLVVPAFAPFKNDGYVKPTIYTLLKSFKNSLLFMITAFVFKIDQYSNHSVVFRLSQVQKYSRHVE